MHYARSLSCSWLISTVQESAGQAWNCIGTQLFDVMLQYRSLPTNYLQGESKKSRPPTSFIDIFASAQSFGIQFCKVIGNIYPCMFTDFRSFILTFSEMALILLRAPIIFMVSSFDCSAVSVAYSANMQSASLREMMLLFSSSNV